jgi:L-fuculose-phosphate aldolase
MSSDTAAAATVEWERRRDIVLVSRWMYDRQLVVARDGNVSCRLGDGTFLMTPSGCCKGTVSEDELVRVDMQGRAIEGERKPTSEVVMHIAAYRERPDVNAVVHAHPITAVAFSVAGISLAQCVVPETVIVFGQIPTAPYATATTPAMATAIEGIVRTADAIVLDRHGSLTLGKDVFDAFYKLEMLEHAAKITHAARMLGEARTLPADEVQRLIEVRKKLGITGPVHVDPKHCNMCGLCPGVK